MEGGTEEQGGRGTGLAPGYHTRHPGDSGLEGTRALDARDTLSTESIRGRSLEGDQRVDISPEAPHPPLQEGRNGVIKPPS